MTRIAMTGASGQYGRLATDKLIAQGRGRDLILITRAPAKLADRTDAGCDVRYGDFDEPGERRVSARGRAMSRADYDRYAAPTPEAATPH